MRQMGRPMLKLVHSSKPHADSDSEQQEWGFENAVQLSLFEDDDRHNLKVIAGDSFTSAQFYRILSSNRPSLLIDTRAFPDFFNLFHSTKEAFKLLESLQIGYLRKPIEWGQASSDRSRWDVRNRIIDTLNIENTRALHSHGLFVLITPNKHATHLFLETLASVPSIQAKWRIRQAQ